MILDTLKLQASLDKCTALAVKSIILQLCELEKKNEAYTNSFRFLPRLNIKWFSKVSNFHTGNALRTTSFALP